MNNDTCDGEELAGVLLANIYGKWARGGSRGQQLYVSVFEKLQRLYTKGADVYDAAIVQCSGNIRKLEFIACI